jgi:hypothetical protein
MTNVDGKLSLQEVIELNDILFFHLSSMAAEGQIWQRLNWNKFLYSVTGILGADEVFSENE